MGNRRVLSRQCNNMHLNMALTQVPLYTLQWNAYTPSDTQKSYLSIGKVKEKIFFALLLLYNMAKPHIYEGKKKRTLFFNGCGKV